MTRQSHTSHTSSRYADEADTVRLECRTPCEHSRSVDTQTVRNLRYLEGLRRFRTGGTIRASARGHDVVALYAVYISKMHGPTPNLEDRVSLQHYRGEIKYEPIMAGS